MRLVQGINQEGRMLLHPVDQGGKTRMALWVDSRPAGLLYLLQQVMPPCWIITPGSIKRV